MRWAYPVTAWDNQAELMAFQGDFETNLGHLRDLGYQGVELLVRDPAQLSKDRLLSLLDKYGLSIAAFSPAPMQKQDGLTLSDMGAAGAACMARLEALIHYAAGLDAPVLLGKLRGNVNGSKQYQLMLSRVRSLAHRAEGLRVPLLIEPQNSQNINFLNTVAQTETFLAEAGAKTVGYHLDTFHLASSEADVAESIKKAGSRIGFLHISDSSRRILGTGSLPLAQYLGQIQDFAPNLWVSPEIRQLPDSFTAAKACITYLNSLDLG